MCAVAGEQERLAHWLMHASSNDRSLSESWSICKAWEAGAMPKDVKETLAWALALGRGRRRAKRLIAASDELVAILTSKLVDAGLSGREVGRALGIKHSTVARLVKRGREIRGSGQVSDGQPPAPPVGSDESN